jgi:hypothetical protein
MSKSEPNSQRAVAIAFPIPLAAPETKATRPVKSNISTAMDSPLIANKQ